MIQRKVNEYDQTKKMLNALRKYQPSSKGMVKEQIEGGGNNMTSTQPKPQAQNTSTEGKDFAVINNVEVQIHSADPSELNLSDEEKGKISQAIDEFRTDVSENVEFGKLQIYESNARLDGRITNIGLGFTLSAGDQSGVYIGGGSMMKIDDESMGLMNKLKLYHEKFSNFITELINTRRNM